MQIFNASHVAKILKLMDEWFDEKAKERKKAENENTSRERIIEEKE